MTSTHATAPSARTTPRTALKAPLPDHLHWLTEKVESLVRLGAFLVPAAQGKRPPVSPQGGTRLHGPADIPHLAKWAPRALAGTWGQSPYDGESLWLQLNLEDIPAEIRLQRPDVPTTGMVWVTIDLSGGGGRTWQAWVYEYPGSARDILWHPRKALEAGQRQPQAMQFVLADTLTCASEDTLPEIANDYHGGVGMCCDYDEWWQAHYVGRQLSDVQLGGWMLPIQGDADELRKTLLLSIERQSFGDSGAVYLHYSVEKGFFAEVQTC